jgi:hypothetical protein
VSAAQAGAISRRQALGCGLSRRQVDWLVRSGRWVRVLPGVFVVHAGPVSAETRIWAAVLYAGPGAAAGGRAALWLWKVVDEPPATVTVCIPADRRVRRQAGLVLRRSERLEAARHPVLSPPRLRVEEAVLDVAAEAGRPSDAVDVVVRAAQRRVTTADRLRRALSARTRHRWRTLLLLVLEDVVVGVLSALEREYLRTVERAHGLPPAEYNPGEPTRERRLDGKRYRDVRYRPWRLVAELDGAQAHPPEEDWKDHVRDNAVTRSGRSTLRYGWRPVADDPCAVAAEVADSLQVRGWGGTPRRCGPRCRLDAHRDPTGNSAHPDVA